MTIRAELGQPAALQSWSKGGSGTLNVCGLDYVTCCSALQGDQDDAAGSVHVCGLQLSGLSLTMGLPESIQLLHWSLLYLDLSNNSFTGSIPQSWMSLRSLRAMELDSNSLSGTLSSSPLSYMTSLQSLSLASNVFSTGTVPAQFSLLTALTRLDLSSIPNIIGSLPASYSLLSHLRVLSLAFNPHLEGSLPPVWPRGMTQLTSLVLVDAFGLCGTVPPPYVPIDSGTGASSNGTSNSTSDGTATNTPSGVSNGTLGTSGTAWLPAVMDANGTYGPGYQAGGSGIGSACPPIMPSAPPPVPASPSFIQRCGGPVLGHASGDNACSSLFYRGPYQRFAEFVCPDGAMVVEVLHKRGTYVWYDSVQAELQVTLVCSDGTVLEFPANVTRTATGVFQAPSYNSSDGFWAVSGTISCLTENLVWLPPDANATASSPDLFRCPDNRQRITGATVSFGYVINTWEFCCADVAAVGSPQTALPPPDTPLTPHDSPPPPAVPPLQPPDQPDPMCPSMGRTSAIVVGQSISTCKEFYPTGSAIRAPKDTATMKYGMIGSYLTQASFIDRTGMSWLVSQAIMPNLTDPSSKTINQLVVQASLSNGTVMAITVMLFIPTDTMVKPFRNTAFIGTITNWGPPYNVNATNWVRWDMGNSIKPRENFLTLEGKVTNLFASVRDAKGRCQSALCTLTSPNSPRCQWYKEFLGNGKAMSLYWDPAMHAPMDSELVPWFASGISYMYGVPRPNELLATNVKLGQQWSFTIHGTPIGTLYQFNGKFSKAPAPCYCS